MSDNATRRYWKSLEERDRDEAFLRAAVDEFPEPLVPVAEAPGALGRRGFLKAAGFSLAGAVAAGCQRGPVTRAIPFLNKPEAVTPGQATWYASTCGACSAACGLLVKNRDGRPIKLEGNPQHPLSRGGLCAVGQASVLGLYDSRRYRAPLRRGQPTSWEEVDHDIVAALDEVRRRGQRVRVLTGTVVSPTLRAAIDRFAGAFDDARHVTYDALSSSAILEAHGRTHGVRTLPHYRFARSEVIVGVQADFLGTWIAPVEFTSDWRDGRSLEGDPPHCSYHVQAESILTVTGSKADRRYRIAPDEAGLLLRHLALRVAERAGVAVALGDLPEPPIPVGELDDLAARLAAMRGRSLVVCGSQSIDDQVLVNLVNEWLGNYAAGATIDLVERPSFQKQGLDRDLRRLLDELEEGAVGALFVIGANPAFDLPAFAAFPSLASRVPLTVSLAGAADETADACAYVCPDHHPLESWGDAEPVAGIVSVIQPVINPLGGTRSAIESLARWAGVPEAPAYDLVRAHWEAAVYPRAGGDEPFQAFWDRAVHDGVAIVSPGPRAVPAFAAEAAGTLAPFAPAAPREAHQLALVLYPKVGMLDGRHAANPWLHELPDPITKVTWDNCACVSTATAARLGLSEGDVVRLEAAAGGAGTHAVELPVYVQPGQHDDVVAVALGYGRRGTNRFAGIGPQWLDAAPTTGDNGLVGVSVSPFIELGEATLRYSTRTVTITATGRTRELATTQRHHSVIEPRRVSPAGARQIVREMTVSELRSQDEPRSTEHRREDLWPDDHPYIGRRWGLVIDLNACTGCSACVVACQVENNIPVVGRDEVRRQREMHWLRIDRYFTDDGGPAEAGPDGLAASVDVVHQPMLCQHCANASCETVCPVLATVHSAEGLNQQVYNRCVGTRYCANNCPYKVRRFNWFTYARPDDRENLVLNPDVTVRTRGIMEKCSLCVQRLQEAKIEAKRRGEQVGDGAVQTACEQSCPARAIVLGDLNDPQSRIASLVTDRRYFQVLEELNERPGVGYLAIVRNRAAAPDETEHA